MMREPRSKQVAKRGLFESIKNLSNAELTSSAVKLAEIAIDLNDQGLDCLTVPEVCKCMIIAAEHYEEEAEFLLAEKFYEKILDLYPNWASCRNKSGDLIEPSISVNEIMYRQGRCLSSAEDKKAAILVLKKIPESERSSSANMLLGNLLVHQGCFHLAIPSFVAVLEACDFALPAAEKLLELGMDWKEVLKLIPKATWCHRWLKTLGLMYAAKYENALKVLDSCPIFSGSPEGKALRGKIFVMQGRYEDSITHFEDAIAKKPTHLRHTDTLARMYCMFSSFKLDQMAGELDKITERVRNVAPNSVESYVCLAYRAVVQKRYELAAALAEKALKMDPYGIETALLMRKCIVDPTKLDKAELVLKRARRAHMTCFDIYDQLMDIYTSTERVSAAAALSKEATKAFGVTARTLHLEAIVLRAAAENSDVETDNSLYRRAAALLEKSIDLDFYYVPAYVTLVEIRRELEMEEENMELLENVQVELHANEIYRELGITYVNLDRHLDKAIAAFHRALRLNQFDMVAVSSLRKLQHLSNVTPFTAELRNLLNRIETATREEEEEETAKNQTDEQMSGAENSAADDSQPWSEDMESEQEMSVD